MHKKTIIPVGCLLLVLFSLSLSAQDSLYLEAEAGTLEAPMIIVEDAEALAGAYVTVTPGNTSTDEVPSMGKVTFSFDLNAGDFKVWGRVFTPTGEDDSFWIQMDDGPIYRWNRIPNRPIWHWESVYDSDDEGREVSWSFTEASTHTLTVYYREDGAKLDAVYITNLSDEPTRGEPEPPSETKTIYVSRAMGTDQNNEGSSPENPVETLQRAYEIASATQDMFGGYEIYLHRGETYEDFATQFSPVFSQEDPARSSFAFIWDLNRELKLGAYGTGDRPQLYGFRYDHEGFPTSGIGVVQPSEQRVLIQDLHLVRWQASAINIFETQNVTVRNVKIEEVGSWYFPDEQNRNDGLYAAGVIYPKNSSNVLIDSVDVQDCRNHAGFEPAIHAVYGTRLNNSEIRHSFFKNIAGSPLKFRREQANNVRVFNNDFLYTGHTEQIGFEDEQPGWLRYSGDANGGCPFSIVIENNRFHYPYCYEDQEDCTSALAIRCSNSNPRICEEGACEDETKVKWIENDFIYEWQPETVSAESSVNPRPFRVLSLGPNPFLERLILRLDLTRPAEVDLTLLDGMGRKVLEGSDAFYEAGEHHLTLTMAGGQQLAPGLYYCQLRVGAYMEYRKVIYGR